MRALRWVTVLAGALAVSGKAAPPRVLYSNDATNLANCPPPGAEHGTVPERLEATIAEAAATDVHLLQPGNGWVPWWRSTRYPADAHYRWFEQVAGREPDLIGRYMRDGGDLVADFIRSCRARGVAPYLSLRLNDYHGSESWDMLKAFARGEHRGLAVPVGLGAMAAQSRVLLEHPENQLKPDPAAYVALPWSEKLAYAADPATRITLRTARVWNWARPEAPAYKLEFVRELCAGYDFDGLELDFMRWASFFPAGATTAAQRREIMLNFIKQTRAALDRTGPPGRRRSLGVRIPSHLAGHDPLGIDLPAWVGAGVDWVDLSCHYISEQQTDLGAISRLIPGTPVYLEMTFASAGRQGRKRASLDGTEELGGYRFTTPEQLFTAAHLAYARGGAGVALFNFAYYRNLGGRPSPPPFAVLARMKDRAWLARQPQHYFLSGSSNPPSGPSAFNVQRGLKPGRPAVLQMDMAPPEGGWRNGGRLRLETVKPWVEAGTQVQVQFNGMLLTPVPEVSEPYPSVWSAVTAPEYLRAWAVPAALLKDGLNRIDIAVTAGEENELSFLDLAVH